MKAILSIVLLIMISACTEYKESKKVTEFLGGETQEEGLFSNRPQNLDSVIAVIKLNRPALLQSKLMQDGKPVISKQARENLIQEQESAIRELKEISSEIRVLFRYQMVLNGLAVLVPVEVSEKLKAIGTIAYIENEGKFSYPAPVSVEKLTQSLANKNSSGSFERNSVKFIGSEEAYSKGISGKGIKVGIIDTGIDYTHSMLGGLGDVEQFNSMDVSKPSELFPNKKVTGGIDLVGTEYNAASPIASKRIPKPDENPIDEGGHGTHVAGTVAGIGDGHETYSGVAPDAELHAIKVFGKNGSTGDAVVIAALEYSADPNKDGDLVDQLDVVNLSLGGGFGSGHILYGEAVKNLSEGGTIVVAASGNSGAVDYITSAPASADMALSVAASIDNTDHNWKFAAVKFDLGQGQTELVEAIEGTFSVPIAELETNVEGPLVYIGLAAQELTEDQKQAVKGKVALIDRGEVNFSTKVERAQEAGAIGVVVVNNQPGEAFAMGGDTKSDIPAIMVSLSYGTKLKEQIKKNEVITQEVTIQFVTSEKIEKKQLIDTITDFSSKGPRIEDSILKPEIAAPGSSVISAAMGEGSGGVKMSGTSMATPHMAGVMALLRQKYPSLSVMDLKTIAMTTTKTLSNSKGEIYPVTVQGAGRVQVDKAVSAKILVSQAAISMGEVSYSGAKIVPVKLGIKNISGENLNFEIGALFQPGLTLLNPQKVFLKKEEDKEIRLQIKVHPELQNDSVRELFGWITLFQEEETLASVATLAVVKATSNLVASQAKVLAESESSSSDALTVVSLSNESKYAGDAQAFNLLALDSRKASAKYEAFLSRACDMQAVGYRILEKRVGSKSKAILQFGVKMYEPLMSWMNCEISILIDADGDQIPEQELALISTSNLPGMQLLLRPSASVLMNAGMTRELRKTFEVELAKGSKKAVENYFGALLDFMPTEHLNHSSVAILEADAELIKRRATGEVAIKVATALSEGSSRESDDFAGDKNEWTVISLKPQDHPFYGLPDKVRLNPGEKTQIEGSKGLGRGDLLILYPQNQTVVSEVIQDNQMQIVKPEFSLAQ